MFRYNVEFINIIYYIYVLLVLFEIYSVWIGIIYKVYELRDVWSKVGVFVVGKFIFIKLLGNKICVDCFENVYIV